MTTTVHIGTPSPNFPLTEVFTLNFHNFANLPSKRGQSVNSPSFQCANGYEWKLRIYPGGKVSSQNDNMLGFILLCHCRPDAKVVAEVDVRLMTSRGVVYKIHKSYGMNSFYLDAVLGYKGFGRANFAKRSEILERSNRILNNGALVFEVRIKPNRGYCCQLPVRTMQPGIADNIFDKLFNDKGSADVAFQVKDTVFYAHRAILKAQAPGLYVLAEQFDKNIPMPINDTVEPTTFKIMLKYIYGKSILAHEWKDHSKPILDASRNYGLSALKLEAEAWYAKELRLTVHNAIDELLYAETTNCTRLKKTVMNYITDHGKAVLTSPSYAKLDKSPRLRKEVLLELAKSKERQREYDYDDGSSYRSDANSFVLSNIICCGL